MVDWELTRGLQNLRSQVNERWPNRDHGSDGTIGDAAHAAGTSGHNPDDSPYDNAEWDNDPDNVSEVRAWDMDTDLREPGTTAQEVVDHIRGLSNVGTVLRYMIYNRKIYYASAGWAPAAYNGPSPHTEHIHFSGQRTQAADRNNTFDYQLDEVGDMALSADDLNKVRAAAKAGFVDALRDAYEAANGKASANTDAARAKRNVRDYVRGIVGGPTEDDIAAAKAEILAAITTAVTPPKKD